MRSVSALSVFAPLLNNHISRGGGGSSRSGSTTSRRQNSREAWAMDQERYCIRITSGPFAGQDPLEDRMSGGGGFGWISGSTGPPRHGTWYRGLFLSIPCRQPPFWLMDALRQRHESSTLGVLETTTIDVYKVSQRRSPCPDVVIQPSRRAVLLVLLPSCSWCQRSIQDLVLGTAAYFGESLMSFRSGAKPHLAAVSLNGLPRGVQHQLPNPKYIFT